MLDEFVTRPRAELIRAIRDLHGPLMIVGASGKMGPWLAILAKRAATECGKKLRVIGVSRFSDPSAKERLEAHGIETIECDVLDLLQVARLPHAPNLIYLVGMKFGTETNPSRTWAGNTIAPANVAARFSKSKIVLVSSGNVYPLVSAKSRGATESTPLIPLGEYPNACVARERIFQYYSQLNSTPLAILRLNYALELRYGVVVDIAEKIRNRENIDVTNGFFNGIWQGDANEYILRSLTLAANPAQVFNLTSPRAYSVRKIALQLGRRMNLPVKFTGRESDTSLLSNAARLCKILGHPPTPINVILDWTSDWVSRGQTRWAKTTGFQVRDGRY